MWAGNQLGPGNGSKSCVSLTKIHPSHATCLHTPHLQHNATSMLWKWNGTRIGPVRPTPSHCLMPASVLAAGGFVEQLSSHDSLSDATSCPRRKWARERHRTIHVASTCVCHCSMWPATHTNASASTPTLGTDQSSLAAPASGQVKRYRKDRSSTHHCSHRSKTQAQVRGCGALQPNCTIGTCSLENSLQKWQACQSCTSVHADQQSHHPHCVQWFHRHVHLRCSLANTQ